MDPPVTYLPSFLFIASSLTEICHDDEMTVNGSSISNKHSR